MLRYVTAVVVLLVCGGAAADVNMTVWAGAGGAVRPEATVAVVVQLQNDNTDRNGIVKAAFFGVGRPETWASQPLDLPRQARKRMTLYLPLQDFNNSILVRYESRNGRIISEYREDLKPQPAETPVIASVGEWPAGLPPAEVNEKQKYTSLQLQTDLLPDRFDGLEMYDCLIITPPPQEPIPSAQVAALREWILRGGTLVVDVSQRVDAFREGPLRDLLPFLPATTEQKTLSVFGKETVYATGEVRGGQILLKTEDTPLVVRKNMGLGSVVCFAFAPGDRAFVQWSGAEALWKDVLGSIRYDEKRDDASDYMFTGSNIADRLGALVSVTPPMPLRLGLVLLLTAVYALVVGPGDYFLVRRLGKPKLTWITFPVIVAVFTFAAYVGARAWIGGEMMSKGMGRILVLPQENAALQFEVSSLFVPEAQDYDIRHAQGAPLLNIRGMSEPESSTVYDQERTRIQQRIPIWTQRLYLARHTRDDYPLVRLSVQDQGDAPVARIENHSDKNLTYCQIAYGQGVYQTNTDVPAGQSATVTLGPEAATFRLDRPDTVQFDEFEDWTARVASLTAFTRELVFADALRRGAVVLHARHENEAPSPLVVDGKPRPERGKLDLYVLEYPGE